MKLWLISQDENSGYDTYDSAVVAADSEDEARCTHPSNVGIADWSHGTWASFPDRVNVKLIGEAVPNTSAGVILESFNAG